MIDQSPRPTSTRIDADVHEWIRKRAFDARRTFTAELNIILREIYAQKDGNHAKI